MEFPLQSVLRDKKLRVALANYGFALNDNNGVFDFLDFEHETMLKNHRALYDHLYQLGGEGLLANLLQTGQTCLTEDPKAAKQGVRPIAGTQRFFLKTNNGALTVLLSILAGIAGWANTAEDFDPDGVVLKELGGLDTEDMEEAGHAGPADEVQEEEDLVFCACGRLSEPPGKCVTMQVEGGDTWRIYSEAQGKCIELPCSDDPSLIIRELAVCEKLTFSPDQGDNDWEEKSEKTVFHRGYRYKLEADGDKWGYINPDFSQVLSPRMDEILFTREGKLLAREGLDGALCDTSSYDVWMLGLLGEEDPFLREGDGRWALYSMRRMYTRTLRRLGLQECKFPFTLKFLGYESQFEVRVMDTNLYRLCLVSNPDDQMPAIAWISITPPNQACGPDISSLSLRYDGHILENYEKLEAIPYVAGKEALAKTIIDDPRFPCDMEWRKKVKWFFSDFRGAYYAIKNMGETLFHISRMHDEDHGVREEMLTPAVFTDVKPTFTSDLPYLVVEQYGRTGVYDPAEDQYVLAVQYDKIDSTASGRLKVCLGGLWGLYSVKNHRFVLPCAYDKLVTGRVILAHGQRVFDWVDKRFNRVLPENCWYVEHLDRQGVVEISPNDVDLIWRVPLG